MGATWICPDNRPASSTGPEATGTSLMVAPEGAYFGIAYAAATGIPGATPTVNEIGPEACAAPEEAVPAVELPPDEHAAAVAHSTATIPAPSRRSRHVLRR